MKGVPFFKERYGIYRKHGVFIVGPRSGLSLPVSTFVEYPTRGSHFPSLYGYKVWSLEWSKSILRFYRENLVLIKKT